MAAAPRFKVFSATGEYLAATKRPEEAAAVVAFLGDGAEIRDGHAKTNCVWREGSESQSASESVDFVAELVWARVGGEALLKRNAR
jgi:hypothetical protein